MPQRKAMICDICGKSIIYPPTGIPGWGQLLGVAVENDKGEKMIEPVLCPEHLEPFATLLKEILNRGGVA